MSVENLWSAADEEDHACDLDKILDVDPPYYQFSVVQGPFAGYPTVNLTRDQLVQLREALNEELGD